LLAQACLGGEEDVLVRVIDKERVCKVRRAGGSAVRCRGVVMLHLC
jgi:hypothetical protein